MHPTEPTNSQLLELLSVCLCVCAYWFAHWTVLHKKRLKTPLQEAILFLKEDNELKSARDN